MTLRLCLWSGPRNVSTALMYSFAQRADTRVVDEPLYAHYLRVSGVDHPGRDEVLADQEADGEVVVRDLILGECDRPVLFMKHMGHHLVDLGLSFLDRTVNVLLIRDPAEVLRTLPNQLPNPSLRDTGLASQCELLDDLLARGQEPPILDAREVLLDPKGILETLCGAVGLEFDPAMLSWSAGARPEDGIWAPHWYHNVHKSTGFAPYRAKTTALDPALEPLLEQCKPYYDRLYARAIRARR